MRWIPLGASAVVLLCLSASTVEARGHHWISHGAHKGSVHGRPHGDLVGRRVFRKPFPGHSPVCEPAYDLVFHRTVCIDPRYNY
jgi:hypothetical protein